MTVLYTHGTVKCNCLSQLLHTPVSWMHTHDCVVHTQDSQMQLSQTQLSQTLLHTAGSWMHTHDWCTHTDSQTQLTHSCFTYNCLMLSHTQLSHIQLSHKCLAHSCLIHSFLIQNCLTHNCLTHSCLSNTTATCSSLLHIAITCKHTHTLVAHKHTALLHTFFCALTQMYIHTQIKRYLKFVQGLGREHQTADKAFEVFFHTPCLVSQTAAEQIWGLPLHRRNPENAWKKHGNVWSWAFAKDHLDPNPPLKAINKIFSSSSYL